MFKVVYTKSLDNVDDVVAESWECENLDLAIQLFNERVNKLVAEVLENAFLKAKISIYQHKALIRIEDIHYCIAIVDDMNHGV